MDKLIDLESIKSMLDSVIKENSLTDEEIAECGAACGCGTTTADLGPAVQYIGAKKDKKEFLDFGTTRVNGNGTKVLNDEPDEDLEKKEFLDANATLSDVNVLGYMKKDSDNQKESSLEEDDINEMSRGILAPQEQARREYISEFPDAKMSTADKFMRDVILNPEAPGHDKYVKRFAYLIRNVISDAQFSDIAADVDLSKIIKKGTDEELARAYADAVTTHRKSMSKSSYDSKGLINAYARNVVKRGPYYKPGRDMVAPKLSIGKTISQNYDDADPKDSNNILVSAFKNAEWKALPDHQKLRELNIIKDNADLDINGLEIVNTEEHKILDKLDQMAGNEF